MREARLRFAEHCMEMMKRYQDNPRMWLLLSKMAREALDRACIQAGSQPLGA